MSPDEAITDLKRISVQIDETVLCDHAGEVLASTRSDAAVAERLARLAVEIWEAADAGRRDLGRDALSQVELSTTLGSVFVVRDDERIALGTTGPDPTVGLVFYDLKSCLHAVARSAGAEETVGQA